MSTSPLLTTLKPTQQDKACSLAEPPIQLPIADEVEANQYWQDFISNPQLSQSDPKQLEDGGAKPFLSAVFFLSPYLRTLALQFPQTILRCAQLGFAEAFEQALVATDELPKTEAELMRQLRLCKREAALVCGIADLGGWWSALDVGAAISEVADKTLSCAVKFLLREAHEKQQLTLAHADDPKRLTEGSGYTVIAMGKHGALELNYSSDIDIIVFFDPEAEGVVDPVESVALFSRMTKRLVKIMQERNEHGYVFRTDLRLRPDPGSMPLAIPLNVAMNYYEGRGQNWERAALIKARCIAGDGAVGGQILKDLTPFIWRRYLDFAAINDVHSIKRQIQAHKDLGSLQPQGHNVKLGRGGIREIEFFVQTQQLIAGGRMEELRGRSTIEMLNALAEAEWIDASTAHDMQNSYGFLRDVEHRLQMINDEQTQTMPPDEEGMKRIAHLSGIEDVAAFQDLLVSHLNLVEKHYSDLFSQAPELSSKQGNLSFTGDEDDPGTLKALEEMGFSRLPMVIATVKGWHFGRHPAMQSPEARERLTEITPALLNAIAQTGRGDEVLVSFGEFLEGLPAGFQLFSLLQTNPKLLELLVRILGTAPKLAKVITRRPHVFDGLLEPGFFDYLPDRATFAELLERRLSLAGHYEEGLDQARIFAAEQRFLIGTRVLGGMLEPRAAGLAFSDLAEVMLEAMLEWVRAEFEKTHGQVPQSHSAILALGNWGDRQLTAGSDLDVVFLYEFSPEQEYSDGPRPLHASQYFGRLVQRFISAMSAPTAEGVIASMDFRLRPGGNSGPIATSLQAFEKYYDGSAWSWEFFALSRARLLSTGGNFDDRVNACINYVLNKAPVGKTLSSDIIDMRKLMDEERPAIGVWDVKNAKGGLVDLEFLIQYQVLIGNFPRGVTPQKALTSLSENELQNDNVTLADLHSTYLDVAQILRLCLDDAVDFSTAPKGLVELILKIMNLPDLPTAEAHLGDMQQAVRCAFFTALET